MCSNLLTSSAGWSLNVAVSQQSMMRLRMLCASATSFKKHECSRTPGMPNVAFSAPTPTTSMSNETSVELAAPLTELLSSM